MRADLEEIDLEELETEYMKVDVEQKVESKVHEKEKLEYYYEQNWEDDPDDYCEKHHEVAEELQMKAWDCYKK